MTRMGFRIPVGPLSGRTGSGTPCWIVSGAYQGGLQLHILRNFPRHATSSITAHTGRMESDRLSRVAPRARGSRSGAAPGAGSLCHESNVGALSLAHSPEGLVWYPEV